MPKDVSGLPVGSAAGVAELGWGFSAGRSSSLAAAELAGKPQLEYTGTHAMLCYSCCIDSTCNGLLYCRHRSWVGPIPSSIW